MDVSNKLTAVFDSKGAKEIDESITALFQHVPQENKSTIERQLRTNLDKANAIGSAATPAQAQELLIREAGHIEELDKLRRDNEFTCLETQMQPKNKDKRIDGASVGKSQPQHMSQLVICIRM